MALSIYAWYDAFREKKTGGGAEQVQILGVALAENEKQAKWLIIAILGWTPVAWGSCHCWPMDTPAAAAAICYTGA